MAKKTDVVLLIKTINDRLEKRFNAHVNGMGVTAAQVRALDFIYSQKNHTATQKELEAYLGVAHPTINGILKRLEEKRFITTEITVNRRFVKIVQVTDKAEKFYAEMKKSRIVYEKLLTGGLTGSERDTLVELLLKVQQSVEA